MLQRKAFEDFRAPYKNDKCASSQEQKQYQISAARNRKMLWILFQGVHFAWEYTTVRNLIDNVRNWMIENISEHDEWYEWYNWKNVIVLINSVIPLIGLSGHEAQLPFAVLPKVQWICIRGK